MRAYPPTPELRIITAPFIWAVDQSFWFSLRAKCLLCSPAWFSLPIATKDYRPWQLQIYTHIKAGLSLGNGSQSVVGRWVAIRLSSCSLGHLKGKQYSTVLVISDLDWTVSPHDQNVVLLLLDPVQYLESGMSGLRLPLWLLALVIGNSPLFCPYHDSTAHPAHCVHHTDNFAIVKDYIYIFEPFHGHIIHRHDNLLTIDGLICLQLQDIVAQVIDVLLLPSKSKATNITPTGHIDVVLRYK